jgi:hypothetical protein
MGKIQMLKKNLPELFSIAIIIFISVSFCYGDITVTDNQTWKLKLGFSERFRIETWDNSISLNSDALAGTSYTRNRTTISSQLAYKKRAELNLKLGNEFRQYFVIETRAFNLNEIYFDQLNLKWHADFGILSTIIVGRQDMSFGEGFVIMDGGPLDGSRSGYFDAARVDLTMAPKKLLTCFYVNQNDKDRFLPRINNKNQAMNPRPEQSFGVYSTNDFSKFNLQGYYIHKHTDETFVGDDDANIHTIGSRIQYPLGSGFTFTAEGAYQFGKTAGSDIAAFGGYGYLTWQSQRWLNRYYALSLGTIYLSGDNHSTTAKYEGWDPLYGRWPKWSESYIYTLVNESGVANWTNLLSLFIKTRYEFSPNVRMFIDYHHLMAPRSSTSNTPFPGGTGKIRGELLTTRLTYNLAKNISGHTIWEYFDPGSYYFSGADHANWLRLEFSLSL